MLDVFLTTDVEVWCDGWEDIDQKFPDCFRRYVYGLTSQGELGLRFQARMLRDHGLLGVFYTEPLFSLRFGTEPLIEIVGLIQEAGHEVQLHLHPEWVDEARVPPLKGLHRKRPLLREFSREDQLTLIDIGRRLLVDAGASAPLAFRAGNFGFNRNTLLALADLGIPFDGSYNAACFGLDSGVRPGEVLLDVACCDGVVEYPMTGFADGLTKFRPAQLSACSSGELEAMLWQAAEKGRRSFTILSHNFELLDRSQRRADLVAVRRFRRLCEFLDRNRDVFRTCGFEQMPREPSEHSSAGLQSPVWRTVMRMAQQAYRIRYH